LKNVSASLRLTGWFSAIFLGGFVLFGLVMWVDLAYSLSQGRDRTLIRRANRFEEAIEATTGAPEQVRREHFEQLADGIPEGNLIQVFDAKGTRVFPSDPEPADFPWPHIAPASRQVFRTFTYGDRPFRMLQFPTRTQPPYLIAVAGQLEDNRNMVARFTTGLFWAAPVMLVLSGLAGYFLGRRVLRPVDEITVGLRSIGIGNLSLRLPVSTTGDELQRLAETCNDTLARLEDAVTRIHRFTADASHELRSPVALIRTVTEYALSNPRTDPDSKEAFDEILAECVEAGALLEDMLTLARADAGHLDCVFEPLCLNDAIGEVCARFQPLAEAKQQVVILRSCEMPVWISGDRSSLRRLLSILIDNAIKYTPAEGRVEVEMTIQASRAAVAVKDSGIGIPKAVLPRVFDRFVRADASRGEVNGTGLGLAIAKWIAGAHRAALTAQSEEGKGSVFAVEFDTIDCSGPAPESDPRRVGE